jgi:hypothetical protein
MHGPVPRFYFHLYNDMVSCDDEGKEFPDRAAAQQQALTYARAMAAVSVREGHLDLSHRIDVTDQDGGIVMSLPFREAVDIQG